MTVKETTYVVTAVVESEEQDSYADPYGRTRYRRDSNVFVKKADAMNFFHELRKVKSLDHRRVANAWVERKTVTLLEKFE